MIKKEKKLKCLDCDRKIDNGNYCFKHRWDDNEYLPKPNECEKVMRA